MFRAASRGAPGGLRHLPNLWRSNLMLGCGLGGASVNGALATQSTRR